MTNEITKMSSKGQVVIPREIRKVLNLEEGAIFSVSISDNSLCLEKIELPKIKSWKEATKPFREAAKKSGFTKEDLDKLIIESRIKK